MEPTICLDCTSCYHSFIKSIPILIYVFYYLSKRKKELCTAKLISCVEDYSFMSYNGISLPVVGYWVRQSYYWAVGPHF